MVFGEVESIGLDKAKEKGVDDCETGESSNSKDNTAWLIHNLIKWVLDFKDM